MAHGDGTDQGTALSTIPKSYGLEAATHKRESHLPKADAQAVHGDHHVTHSFTRA